MVVDAIDGGPAAYGSTQRVWRASVQLLPVGAPPWRDAQEARRGVAAGRLDLRRYECLVFKTAVFV